MLVGFHGPEDSDDSALPRMSPFSHTFRSLLCVLFALGTGACNLFDNYADRPYLGPDCTQDSRRTCSCPNGESGWQRCTEEGRYGACRCGGDASDGGATPDGADGDGGEPVTLAELTSCASEASPTPADSLVYFDATKISGPDAPTTLPDMEWFDFVGEGKMWPADADRAEPHRETLIELGATFEPDRRYGLNIQQWGWKRETIDKYVDAANWVTRESPNALVGFYDMPPARNFDEDRQHLLRAIRGPNLDTLTAWANRWNERATRVAEEVDFIMPSVFPVTDDMELWETYASAKICEAKQYESLGRNVYPAVWMQWSAGIPTRESTAFVPRSIWKRMLSHVRSLGVPGIVVYTNSSDANGDALTWTADGSGQNPQKGAEWLDVLQNRDF